MKLASWIQMSVLLPSLRWKRKQRKRSLSCEEFLSCLRGVPPNSQHFIYMPTGHVIFRKGAIYVYCTGWPILIYCTHHWFCFLLQYPGDCISPSTWVATLPPVRLLWAEDWSATQATPPGPLWDRRQPRGCQSPNRWPPCGSGMDLTSLYFVFLICY